MIIFNGFNYDDLIGPLALELDHQAPLLVQPHRVLVLSISLEPLEVERSQPAEGAFVRRGCDDLHHPAEGSDDALGEPLLESKVRIESLEVTVVEPEFHDGADPTLGPRHLSSPPLHHV